MNGILQVPGVKDIKSIHSAGTRSIPKIQRSSYLELYMLKREKDRVEKELFASDKRRNTANRQLDSISKGIEKIQKEVYEEQKIKTYRGMPARQVKTMAISY